jgi:hypothetical protein
MPLRLEDIKAPITREMQDFEKKFRASMKTKVLLLDKIMGYIVKRKGKQMRPIFVFLSAVLSGEIKEATFRGAALIELLHTATLVHDDVVDEANYRRGFFSVNALWKNKIAVLVGDFLLSRGLLLSVENKDFDLLRIVSSAVREMSEGELLQFEKSRKLDITEDVYFDIIRQKTASLIASCCAVGASSAGASDTVIPSLCNVELVAVEPEEPAVGRDGVSRPDTQAVHGVGNVCRAYIHEQPAPVVNALALFRAHHVRRLQSRDAMDVSLAGANQKPLIDQPLVEPPAERVQFDEAVGRDVLDDCADFVHVRCHHDARPLRGAVEPGDQRAEAIGLDIVR